MFNEDLSPIKGFLDKEIFKTELKYLLNLWARKSWSNYCWRISIKDS